MLKSSLRQTEPNLQSCPLACDQKVKGALLLCCLGALVMTGTNPHSAQGYKPALQKEAGKHLIEGGEGVGTGKGWAYCTTVLPCGRAQLFKHTTVGLNLS